MKHFLLKMIPDAVLKKLLFWKANLFYTETRNFIPSETEQETQRKGSFPASPLISIITPVFNTQKDYLVNLLESVRNQTYSRFEICLYDTSDAEHGYTEEICRSYQEKDKRFIYIRGGENLGIVGNSNRAAEYAHGEYLALLDHDDILLPHALFENIALLNRKTADFIYSDEGYFMTDPGKIYKLRQKPEFDQELLRQSNFICHFVLIRTALFHEAGGFRNGYDGSQDHELFLRLSERTRAVVHLPKVLYLWRINPFSFSQNKMDVCRDSGLRAVREHLQRCGISAEVTVEGKLPVFHIQYTGVKK